MLSGSGDALSPVSACSSERVKQLSQKLYKCFRSYESFVLWVQKVLIWEKTVQSVVFFCLAHAVFLLISLQSHHIFGYIFSATLLGILVDLWKHKIWPEVRAVPPDEDAEWSELHPKQLGFLEICEVFAEKILMFQSVLFCILETRRNFPGKFCIVFCACCTVLCMVGEQVPGILVSYIVLLFMLLWPLMWYHNILTKTLTYLKPFAEQLEYVLKYRSPHCHPQTKSLVSKPLIEKGDDIEDFVPSSSEETEAILARALCDESEHSESGDDACCEEIPSGSRSSTPDGLTANETYLNALPSEFPVLVDSSDSENESVYEKNLISSQHSNTKTLNSQTMGFPANGSEMIVGAIGNIFKDTLSTLVQSVHQDAVDANVVHSRKSSASGSDFELLDIDKDNVSS